MKCLKQIKALPFSIIFILVSLFWNVNSAFSWTGPRKLTDHLYIEDPRAVCHGSNIYLVNYGTMMGAYFLSSPNNGFSWADPVEPADTFPRGANWTDICYSSNGLLHLAWQGYYSGNPNAQIFHQSSSDGGRHWSNRHPVFYHNQIYLTYPRIISRGDTLFLVCRDDNYLFLFRSYNAGLTWQDSTIVDVPTNMDCSPILLYSQGRLHLVYELNISLGGVKIYYSQSDDLGLHWRPRIYLSSYEQGPPFYHSQLPAAYADEDGHIIATWFDYQYGSYCGYSGDILGRISTDNGNSWLPETRITYTQSGEASGCLILNNNIYVVWMDDWPFGCECPKIMFSASSDWGLNWQQPEVITGPRHLIEMTPFLSASIANADTFIHCFYAGVDSSNTTDIYQVRNISFFSDHMPLPPAQPVVLKIKASPSVFNSSTIISYENTTGDEAEIEIYNVLGQRVWSKEVYGREGMVVWDAKDMNGNGLSSGIYFIKVTSKGLSAKTKFTYLK